MSASTEIIPYAGWARNLRIANDEVELVVTLDVGPRVIRYAAPGARNLFGETADHLGRAGEPHWMPRGGHRLWTAPEDKTRTYAPDNHPVEHQPMAAAEPGGVKVRLQQPADAAHGVQKQIDIALGATGTRATVVHRIINVGDHPITLAPWALTVMPPGGTAIVPLPAKRLHPGSLPNAVDADYWPNQTIALWSYLDLRDPRLTLGTRFITARQDPTATTLLKFGLSHDAGWLAYWRQGDLFVKWVDYQRGATYPDSGCNFELYCDPTILEVETLGPLVTLAPGEKTEHTETWRLFSKVGPVGDEISIASNVAALLDG